MPINAIAILPINGYQSRDATSFPASQWLTWIESQESEKAEIGEYKMFFTNQAKLILVTEKSESNKLVHVKLTGWW